MFSRINLAVILLILFAILANIRQTWAIFKDPIKIGKDPVTVHEQRFEAIKKELPVRGIVGYITEVSWNEVRSDMRREAEYFIAWYSLAPIILDIKPDYDIVVGNFRCDTPVFKNPGLTLVRKFGDGIMLFKKKQHDD